jgi:hypothetical protein
MSHHVIRRLTVAVALLFAVSSPVFALCSSHTVRGAWAFQNQGTVMMPAPGYPMPVPVPFVSLGIMDIDAQGTFSIKATISVGGQVQDVETSGTLLVSHDCTITATDALGGTAQGMILDEGREMRMMATAFPLGPSTNMAYFRRIARGDPRCSNATVRGVYRGTGVGTFMVPVPGQPQPVPMPFSGVFTSVFDGDGGGDVTATSSLAGTIADVTFSDVSMIVNRDCTATLTYTGVVKQLPGQLFTGTLKYIVLDHGDGLIGMEVESNIGLPIELESHTRVSRLRSGFEW